MGIIDPKNITALDIAARTNDRYRVCFVKATLPYRLVSKLNGRLGSPVAASSCRRMIPSVGILRLGKKTATVSRETVAGHERQVR